MAKIKLTKSDIDAAQPQAQSVELRDTLVPGKLFRHLDTVETEGSEPPIVTLAIRL
jgi:hypothetical protein